MIGMTKQATTNTNIINQQVSCKKSIYHGPVSLQWKSLAAASYSYRLRDTAAASCSSMAFYSRLCTHALGKEPDEGIGSLAPG